jgi:hypothetical protein
MGSESTPPTADVLAERDEHRIVRRAQTGPWTVYVNIHAAPTSYHDTKDDAMARALTSVRCSGGGLVEVQDEAGRPIELVTIDAEGVELELGAYAVECCARLRAELAEAEWERSAARGLLTGEQRAYLARLISQREDEQGR